MIKNREKRDADMTEIENKVEEEIKELGGLLLFLEGRGFGGASENIKDTIRLLREMGDLIQNQGKLKHKWNKDDVEDAKAIKRLFPNCMKVLRSSEYESIIILRDKNNNPLLSFTAREMFKSLKPGESVNISEITEEENKNE